MAGDNVGKFNVDATGDMTRRTRETKQCKPTRTCICTHTSTVVTLNAALLCSLFYRLQDVAAGFCGLPIQQRGVSDNIDF
jgi:hypothetical protein